MDERIEAWTTGGSSLGEHVLPARLTFLHSLPAALSHQWTFLTHWLFPSTACAHFFTRVVNMADASMSELVERDSASIATFRERRPKLAWGYIATLTIISSDECEARRIAPLVWTDLDSNNHRQA